MIHFAKLKNRVLNFRKMKRHSKRNTIKLVCLRRISIMMNLRNSKKTRAAVAVIVILIIAAMVLTTVLSVLV